MKKKKVGVLGLCCGHQQQEARIKAKQQHLEVMLQQQFFFGCFFFLKLNFKLWVSDVTWLKGSGENVLRLLSFFRSCSLQPERCYYARCTNQKEVGSVFGSYCYTYSSIMCCFQLDSYYFSSPVWYRSFIWGVWKGAEKGESSVPINEPAGAQGLWNKTRLVQFKWIDNNDPFCSVTLHLSRFLCLSYFSSWLLPDGCRWRQNYNL